MGEIITIPQAEVKTIEKRSTLVGMDYNPTTVNECAKLYKDAPQIAEIAKMAVKDGLQGKALLEAKKLICKDEWDKANEDMSENVCARWFDFLRMINLMSDRKDGRIEPKTTVRNLLNFAGYKESGGEIESAAHYEEVKKVVGKDTKDIDNAYNEAGGKELTTAKEVKESVVNTSKKVYVRSIFEREVGVLDSDTLTSMQFERAVFESLPEISKEEWKKFYYKVSKIVHPDQGEESDEQRILSSFNKMMGIVFKQEAEVTRVRAYEADYKIWKEDHGYKDNYIKEDEL